MHLHDLTLKRYPQDVPIGLELFMYGELRVMMSLMRKLHSLEVSGMSKVTGLLDHGDSIDRMEYMFLN